MELAELAGSCDAVVLDTLVQRRHKLDPRFLLGKGKIDELVIASLQHGADIIIFNQSLTPAQVRSIAAATDLKILDRTQLISISSRDVPKAERESCRSSWRSFVTFCLGLPKWIPRCLG